MNQNRWTRSHRCWNWKAKVQSLNLWDKNWNRCLPKGCSESDNGRAQHPPPSFQTVPTVYRAPSLDRVPLRRTYVIKVAEDQEFPVGAEPSPPVRRAVLLLVFRFRRAIGGAAEGRVGAGVGRRHLPLLLRGGRAVLLNRGVIAETCEAEVYG